MGATAAPLPWVSGRGYFPKKPVKRDGVLAEVKAEYEVMVFADHGCVDRRVEDT